MGGGSSTPIRALLWDLRAAGKLVCVPPSHRFPRRIIYCVPEVWQAVQAAPPTQVDDRRIQVSAEALLRDFVTGAGPLSVRISPSKYPYAALAWLEPPEEEIWAFRCRDCEPQIRVFGRFADYDLFIALIWRTKTDCHTAEHYRAAMQDCRKSWDSLLLGFPPFRGARVHDYLSGAKAV